MPFDLASIWAPCLKTSPKCALDQIQREVVIVVTEYWEFSALSRKQIYTSLIRSVPEQFPSRRCDLAHYKALRQKLPFLHHLMGKKFLNPSPSKHPPCSRTPVKPVQSPLPDVLELPRQSSGMKGCSCFPYTSWEDRINWKKKKYPWQTQFQGFYCQDVE